MIHLLNFDESLFQFWGSPFTEGQTEELNGRFKLQGQKPAGASSVWWWAVKGTEQQEIWLTPNGLHAKNTQSALPQVRCVFPFSFFNRVKTGALCTWGPYKPQTVVRRNLLVNALCFSSDLYTSVCCAFFTQTYRGKRGIWFKEAKLVSCCFLSGITQELLRLKESSSN